jgi:hypothetical protein
MTSRSFVVYADESNTHDRSLAHRQFYGGCLVPAEDRDAVARQLGSLAHRLGLLGELKWRKVRPENADRVLQVMNAFFDLIEGRRMKLRVMWLPRSMDDVLRDPRYADYGYYLLYYFFIVSGFALSRHGEAFEVLVEFFPDTLPDEPEKKQRFVDFLTEAHRSPRYGGRAPFKIVRVADVDSKKHVLLQCCDVVIGALGFLMNARGEESGVEPLMEGTRIRERFAHHIVERIARVHRTQVAKAPAYSLTRSTWPGSTASGELLAVNHWRFPYRQWCFASRSLVRYSGWRRYARGSSAESRPA